MKKMYLVAVLAMLLALTLCVAHAAMECDGDCRPDQRELAHEEL